MRFRDPPAVRGINFDYAPVTFTGTMQVYVLPDFGYLIVTVASPADEPPVTRPVSETVVPVAVPASTENPKSE